MSPRRAFRRLRARVTWWLGRRSVARPEARRHEREMQRIARLRERQHDVDLRSGALAAQVDVEGGRDARD